MTLEIGDLDGSVWLNHAHYNLGSGGYGYGYTHKDEPRVRVISYSYRGERREKERKPGELKWFVDGAEVADKAAVICALSTPPVLTDEERVTLERVPAEFVDLRPFETALAGVPHPEGPIEPDTPHARALDLLRRLEDKGAIEYGRCRDGERSVPTIRRRAMPSTEAVS